jgi:hypothetical protein
MLLHRVYFWRIEPEWDYESSHCANHPVPVQDRDGGRERRGEQAGPDRQADLGDSLPLSELSQ